VGLSRDSSRSAQFSRKRLAGRRSTHGSRQKRAFTLEKFNKEKLVEVEVSSK